MLLIVTNNHDPTVDFVEEHLKQEGQEYVRLNTESFFTHFVNTTYIDSHDPSKDDMMIDIGAQVIDLSKISAIWYRRPVDPNPHPSILSSQAIEYVNKEGYYYVRDLWRMLRSATWVSRPDSISWANVKLDQLKVARNLGLVIPRSLATTDPDKARSFYSQCEGRMIVKPFTTTTLEYGTDLVSILTNRVTEDHLLQLDQVRMGITFFQEEIPKDFEVRVTVIGESVFSAKIDSQSDQNRMVDWRNTSQKKPAWQHHAIPESIANICREMVNHYGLRFGTFDFAFTPKGEYVFFELNPNGQWAWLEIELGLPMTRSLVKTFGI